MRSGARVLDPALALRPVRAAVHRLPPFALPGKRYVMGMLRRKSGDYLGSDVSYREVVTSSGRSVVYDDRQDHPLAKRGAALAGSTVWRWLSWWGNLAKTVRAALQLIREKAPSHTLHRETWPVPPHKVRSEERRGTLQVALQALAIEQQFPRLFGKEIFPNFATACGWS
jgi:hypothetical protein